MPGQAGERNAFAEHLRRLRLRAGLTQEALAERAGVSVATIGAIKEGQRRRPYPHTLRALADSLDLSAAERATLLSLQAETPTAAAAPPATPLSPLADFALPIPPTPLVGRESEIAQASALVSDTQAVRLLT